MSRYPTMTLEQLEAEEAALTAALEAKRREVAMETLLAIDGELYPPPSTILEGEA